MLHLGRLPLEVWVGPGQANNLYRKLLKSFKQMVVVDSLVAQTVKCLPTMRETLVQSLGREDPLEKEMATHSSILAWRIPWTEEPSGKWVRRG